MSSTCENIRDLLVEHLAHELDRFRAAGVESHLAGCAACRAEESELRATLALLSEDAAPDPGERYWDSFAGRVRMKIAARPEPRRRGFTLPRFALAASLVLVTIVAVRAPRIAIDSEEEDSLLASILPLDPAALEESIGELSGEEGDRFEQHLVALGRRATPSPTPTPAPASTGKDKKEKPKPAFDPAPTQSHLQDDLSDLDELSPEELDRLLEHLDAMKT